jgi:hypothetical protein
MQLLLVQYVLKADTNTNTGQRLDSKYKTDAFYVVCRTLQQKYLLTRKMLLKNLEAKAYSLSNVSIYDEASKN